MKKRWKAAGFVFQCGCWVRSKINENKWDEIYLICVRRILNSIVILTHRNLKCICFWHQYYLRVQILPPFRLNVFEPYIYNVYVFVYFINSNLELIWQWVLICTMFIVHTTIYICYLVNVNIQSMSGVWISEIRYPFFFFFRTRTSGEWFSGILGPINERIEKKNEWFIVNEIWKLYIYLGFENIHSNRQITASSSSQFIYVKL